MAEAKAAVEQIKAHVEVHVLVIWSTAVFVSDVPYTAGSNICTNMVTKV